MKKLATLLILAAAAAAASASPMLAPDGAYHAAPPSRLETPDGVATIGNPDALLAYGWAYASPERIAAEEAAQAAAQAEAEAAASLPLQSATGFAVQDSDGHWIELEPTGDGLPVIGVRVSNSPLTPEERAAMKAERKTAHDALKAASQDKKLNDKAKVALLMKAVFGVEE
jgi:hypothetical protein